MDMFEDFSSRALSCSEEIATFNALYVKSSAIFEQAAATRARNSVGIQRLGVHETFLPPEQAEEDAEVAINQEDVEMKDSDVKEEDKEEETVENTKPEDIEDVLEEFEGRLMHRDVVVEELPGGTPNKKSLKVFIPSPPTL